MTLSVGTVERDSAFERAKFSINLNLPPAPSDALRDAALAVRQELRKAATWKRLRCRNVNVVSQTETGGVYELEIGHAIEFDWSWEGAVAFRPLLLKEFEGSQATLFVNGSLDPDISDSILWSGEVLEVDEATGRLFVVVGDPGHPPRCGSFYVRPFEYLTVLDAVFNEPVFETIRGHLQSRLAASCGGVHPDASDPCEVGLADLRSWWRKSWCVLWGPPGTGKTFTAGHQVASVLADPSERILVVSTTNKATDAAALSIGRAAQKHGVDLADGTVRRMGKGASFRAFEAEGLTDLLRGTETELLAQIETVAEGLANSRDPQARAMLRQQIQALRGKMLDAALRDFLDADVRVVIGTSFKAASFLNRSEVRDGLERGEAPFTTVIIDEAGLLSRAAIAALSLLAGRRVVLVGDSKQLAPISGISRIVATPQRAWLDKSGLSHLDQIRDAQPGVHVLREQRRMHPQVCDVVSDYLYEGFLTTSADVASRESSLPDLMRGQLRAIWYVLDEDTDDISSIRAARGPGNRSWVRTATKRVLQKLFVDPSFRSARGLFISPFRAQARAIHAQLVAEGLGSWVASTVHSQQGSEADIVVFDTVNAGSYGWSFEEWRRLVNVALSRSRESVILLASRAEMHQPYLRPLLRGLAPRVLRKHGARLIWGEVSAEDVYRQPIGRSPGLSHSIGDQITQRKKLRPVLSQEQERLCGLVLDGKPRLVRGVAGSGKTVVLANWLMQIMRRFYDQPDFCVWAVFANRSLQSLIGDAITSAWETTQGGPFPWDRVHLRHIREVLGDLLPEVGLSVGTFEFDYDRAAEAYLLRKPIPEVLPRCDALFVDEAQDMGPSTLKLLSAVVRKTDPNDEKSRPINLFYDNAQNIYGRGVPKWSDLGLDMRGRSTVMKESFRSTRPITEFALNVLYRLQSPESNPDHRELVARGLIEPSTRRGAEWWNVRFNQIDGPIPECRHFPALEQEFEAIGDYCRELIEANGVQPSDICLIYNGKSVPDWLRRISMPRLAGLGVELSVQTNRPFGRSSKMLLATTSHSYKGYDSEVVIIPSVELYRAKEKGVLANNLYVAMTRARSVLTLFSHSSDEPQALALKAAIDGCLDCLYDTPEVDAPSNRFDDFHEILELIGFEHSNWLQGLFKRYSILQEPLMTSAGELIAEPLFTVRAGGQTYSCFGAKPPNTPLLQKLELYGVKVIVAGEQLPATKPS